MLILILSLSCAVSAQDLPPAGHILGLSAVKEPLPWFDEEPNYPTFDGTILDMRPNAVPAVTSLGRPPMTEPISVMLSRYRYPAEDGWPSPFKLIQSS